MHELFTVLKDWQGLVGSVLAAGAALAAAFLVSFIDRRRENLAAAMVVVGNLTTIVGAERTLAEIAEQTDVGQESYTIWVALRLTATRPRLSPLFDGYVARLMLIDVKLAAHLELFKVVYRDIEHHLDRLEQDIQYFNLKQQYPRPEEDIRRDLKLVGNGFGRAARYADCAEHLLSQLVLTNWPTVHRIRRAVFKTEREKECEKLLQKGAL